jgi:hypothetical protein
MNRLAKRLLPIAILAARSGPLHAQARQRDVILTTDCGAEIDDGLRRSTALRCGPISCAASTALIPSAAQPPGN